MEWIKIDKEKLPRKEVLAANFRPRTYGYKEKMIGCISIDEYSSYITCENEYEILYPITHYIDIHKHNPIRGQKP